MLTVEIANALQTSLIQQPSSNISPNRALFSTNRQLTFLVDVNGTPVGVVRCSWSGSMRSRIQGMESLESMPFEAVRQVGNRDDSC